MNDNLAGRTGEERGEEGKGAWGRREHPQPAAGAVCAFLRTPDLRTYVPLLNT